MFVNVVTTAANARPMMNATAISTRLPFAMKSRNSFSMTTSLRRYLRGGYPNAGAVSWSAHSPRVRSQIPSTASNLPEWTASTNAWKSLSF